MTVPAHVSPATDAPYDIELEDAVDAFVINADYFLGDDARCGIKGCGDTASYWVDYHCGHEGSMCNRHEAEVEAVCERVRAGLSKMRCPVTKTPLNPDAIDVRPI